MINLLVLKETLESEKRVALVPDEIKKYFDLGFKVTIEKEAGLKSGFLNEDYKKQNANISQNIEKSIKESDIIIKIQKPELRIIKENEKWCNFNRTFVTKKEFFRKYFL